METLGYHHDDKNNKTDTPTSYSTQDYNSLQIHDNFQPELYKHSSSILLIFSVNLFRLTPKEKYDIKMQAPRYKLNQKKSKVHSKPN